MGFNLINKGAQHGKAWLDSRFDPFVVTGIFAGQGFVDMGQRIFALRPQDTQATHLMPRIYSC
ncbi:MAG: hypothetical protein K6U03_08460 [Firmicutes bacterium]|nr:hypothetical protein [Bacillota bacterium]